MSSVTHVCVGVTKQIELDASDQVMLRVECDTDDAELKELWSDELQSGMQIWDDVSGKVLDPSICPYICSKRCSLAHPGKLRGIVQQKSFRSFVQCQTGFSSK